MALLLLFSFSLSRLHSPSLLSSHFSLLLLPFLSLSTHRGSARPHLTRPPLRPPPVLILRKTVHLLKKSQSSQPRKLSLPLQLAQRRIFLMEQHLTDRQVERVAVKWALSYSLNRHLLVLVTLDLVPWCPRLLRRLERLQKHTRLLLKTRVLGKSTSLSSTQVQRNGPRNTQLTG